jgi:hypothetical protein
MDINFSIGRIILLTYIIIASNFCSDLFSNGLKKAIKENKFLQHLILIILIISLMICFGNPFLIPITSNQEVNVLIMSLLIYVWFIMITKLDVAWNIGTLILLTIYFIYDSQKLNYQQTIMNDKNVDLFTKNKLFNEYVSMQKYLLLSLFGITLVGTLFYVNEKQVQYGDNFDIINLILK